MRQGGVLSPILFTVYLDELLQQLTLFGFGFEYNLLFNLLFNAAKMQLIYFCSSPRVKFDAKFFFLGHLLQFSDSVTHLSHVLHCSLDDSPNIKRATLEICKKANIILSIFSSCDPQFSLPLTAYHCMVVLSGTYHTVNLAPWRLHLMIFSGISGGFRGIATHKYSIKLLIWTCSSYI